MAGLELMFSDEACAEALSDEKLLAAMSQFEAALALAAASAGLVPVEQAQGIASVCAEFRPDPAALAPNARSAGTLAIPFVNELRAAVKTASPAAAAHL